mmetsp:Transcript_71142/g.141373  ORF Transcript_71142/g.141373 Transcript_71142/m.141373 type:complete len:107 (-) Transcript_71142:26-346(-)
MVLLSLVVQSTGLVVLAVGVLATGDFNDADVKTEGGSNGCHPGWSTSADIGITCYQRRSINSKIDIEVDETQDIADVDGAFVHDESTEKMGEGDDGQVLDEMDQRS